MDDAKRQQLRDAAQKVLDANTDEELVTAHHELTRLQADPRAEEFEMPPMIFPPDIVYRITEAEGQLTPPEGQPEPEPQAQAQQQDKPSSE